MNHDVFDFLCQLLQGHPDLELLPLETQIRLAYSLYRLRPGARRPPANPARRDDDRRRA